MRKRGESAPEYSLEPIIGLSREELDSLFSVTYEELRRLASSLKHSDRNATLNPTTLVHEAWVKLAKSPSFAATSPLHFKRIAARAMRQVLVESARRRLAGKRGGAISSKALSVPFDEARNLAVWQDDTVIRMDAALQELARLNPRQALMVESRFFGGLGVSETAELLEVSQETVMRDWRAVKAWLGRELSAGD